MSLWNIFIAIGIGFAFIAWPIIGKSTQVAGVWLAVIASAATTITVVLYSGRSFTALPSIKSILIIFCAGILNGIALYYYVKKATDPEIATAVFVVLVSVLMSVMIAGGIFIVP